MVDRLRRLFFRIHNWYFLTKYNIKRGKNLQIRGCIYAMGKIEIGANVSINSGFRYNPIGGQDRTILVAHGGGNIVIGNNVGMSNCAIVSMDSVIVEDDVKIGGNVKIYDTDFHSIHYNLRMEKLDIHTIHKPVRIKKGAFIGAHSIILKGVTIGEESVIGAGSVVSKDVPDGEIWAGNPARFIRKVSI